MSEFRAKHTEASRAADKANRRLPRNGAAGPRCQAATVADGRREIKDRRASVAEVHFVDAGRPDGRQTKAHHSAGGGLEAGRGTREQSLHNA